MGLNVRENGALLNSRISRRGLGGLLVASAATIALSGCNGEKIRVRDEAATDYFTGKVTVDPSANMQQEYDGFWEIWRVPQWIEVTSIYNQPVDLSRPFTVENPLITRYQSKSGALYHLLKLPVSYQPDSRKDLDSIKGSIFINMDLSSDEFSTPEHEKGFYVPITKKLGEYFKVVNGEAVGEPIKYGIITQEALQSQRVVFSGLR